MTFGMSEDEYEFVREWLDELYKMIAVYTGSITKLTVETDDYGTYYLDTEHLIRHCRDMRRRTIRDQFPPHLLPFFRMADGNLDGDDFDPCECKACRTAMRRALRAHDRAAKKSVAVDA